MSLPKSFIQAWQVWQHSDAPITNSQLRRHTAMTYKMEVQLDHLSSYLYAMGANIIGGKILPAYEKQTEQEIAELKTIKIDLEKCEIPESEKEKFKKYISITETLYQEIKTLLISQM